MQISLFLFRGCVFLRQIHALFAKSYPHTTADKPSTFFILRLHRLNAVDGVSLDFTELLSVPDFENTALATNSSATGPLT